MTCNFCGHPIRGTRVDAVSGSYCLGHEPSAGPDEKDKRIADLMEMAETWERRATGQKEWLTENAPYTMMDQKHLDKGSVAHAYWHYGYMTALQDAVRLARGDGLPKPNET